MRSRCAPGPGIAALLVALLPLAAAAADDCSTAGTRAFRAEGVDAALAAFTAARARPECAGDGQLAFNYARTLQTALDRDGDDRRACAAADAYAEAARDPRLAGQVQALAAKARVDLSARCAAVQQKTEAAADYPTLVERARARVRAGDKAGAAEAWKAASALQPETALPHRALCSLLPDLGRADEGRGHCRQWRALEPAAAAVSPASGSDRTVAWVLTAARRRRWSGAGWPIRWRSARPTTRRRRVIAARRPRRRARPTPRATPTPAATSPPRATRPAAARSPPTCSSARASRSAPGPR
ncbi:MAG: hypothetical protein H6703_02130 [Myxococcales bacterium]|nr:hypothetical protein [Myxococcales bacterium]